MNRIEAATDMESRGHRPGPVYLMGHDDNVYESRNCVNPKCCARMDTGEEMWAVSYLNGYAEHSCPANLDTIKRPALPDLSGQLGSTIIGRW